MRSSRFVIQYLHALALIICFIQLSRSVTNPEDFKDVKMVESSDQDFKDLPLQDAKHLMKSPYTEIDQVLANVDGDTGLEGSTSTNYLLSAYAPEFGPSKVSNPRNNPKSQQSANQHFVANHPHDTFQGSKKNSAHSHGLWQGVEVENCGTTVPINTHKNVVMDLKTIPTEKGMKIQEGHKGSASTKDTSSKNNYKSVQADTRPSGADLVVPKEGTMANEGSLNKVEGTSNIENSYSHRLQKSLKPGNLMIEQVGDKDNKMSWSGKKPPFTIKAQTKSRLGQGTLSLLPGNPILDSSKSKLVFEKQSFMESPLKEVKIERSSPREDSHGYKPSDRVEETVSNSKDDWIIPKKTFKNRQIREVDISQDAMITGLPKIHQEPFLGSIFSLEGSKVSSKKLQNSSKNHKKKKNSSSKLTSHSGKKGRAGKDIGDDWDTELLKALEEASVSDERQETEHEKLIKNLQKRLQNIFVSDDNRKIDLPSSSSHPSYRSLMKEFLCVKNHTPRLKLHLESQTVKTLREAELEAKLSTSDNVTYWLQIIDEILAEELASVDPIEVIRRKQAFFLQYLLIKDSEIFKEKKDMWGQEARQVATLLRCENPFELFLDITKEEIEFLEPHLKLMAASEHELLSHLSKRTLDFRRSMITLRIQELATPSPHGFFGRDFLESACQQAFHMPMFRQFEIVLELSAPEVSWKGLSENDLEKKYFQMLNFLAGMPGRLSRSPATTEAELYSQAESNWRDSHAAQIIFNDPELSQHVTNRLKLFLMALKGKGIKPLRKIWKDSEGSSRLELNEELISRDEAIAATFVGISLPGIARFKSLLRNRDISVQGTRRPYIHLNGSLTHKYGLAESLTIYHELLGIKLLYKD